MAEVQIPTTQRACVYDKPGEVSCPVREIPVPQPGPGEVLVHLTHSGVCHSDHGVMMCNWAGLPYPTPKDQVGGHEGVGKIVKMGPGNDESPVSLGDRVGIKWLAYACGGCPACLEGRDGVCFAQKVSGYFWPGTFQQYAIAPAHYLTPIPDGIESAAAAPLLCAGVTVYSALRKSDTRAGQWVVVLGAAGGLGHLAVQFASKGMGLRVIGVDSANKEKLVRDSGAEHFIAVGGGGGGGGEGGQTTAKQVMKLTDGMGAHAVIVCTSANAAYAEACDMLRFGGTCVCVGIPENKPVAIGSALPQFLIAKEIRIVGSAVGSRKDAVEAMDFAARGLVKVHYKLEKMDQLGQIFKDMHEGKMQGRVVLDLSA